MIPIAVGGAIYWGHNLTYDQLYIKVNTDLSVSKNIFQRLQSDYQRQLERFAESYAFREAWDTGNKASTQAQLEQLKSSGDFSYLLFNEAFRFTDSSSPIKVNLGRPSKLREQALRGHAATGVEVF